MKNFIKNLFYYASIIIILLLIIFANIENGLLLSLISILAIYVFVKKINIKNFSLFLIITSLLIKIIFVIFVKTPIMADSFVMYEAAKKALANDFSFVNDFYFRSCGYQLFHVFYETLALKIINNVLFLKILNCIYSTVITFMIYLITKKLTSEQTARITSLLYLISIYTLYLNTTLNNHQLSLMLIMISIYIILYKTNNYKNLILASLLLAISNLERPEGIVYLLTILIYFIVSNKEIRITVKKSLIVLFTFLLITKGSSYILIKTNFNEIGFGNDNPSWKFLLGFNYESNGMYNYDDETLSTDKNVVKKETINRIKMVNKWPKLFYNKSKILWLYDDFNEESMPNSIPKYISKIIVNYIKVMNIIIIILGLLGLIKLKNEDKTLQFFLINLCIYFGIYLLIEVQTRYYFNPQVSVIIISSIGIQRITNIIKDKKLLKNI